MLELALSALAIMAMRVVDVSIGTVRIVMIMRSRLAIAAVLGFFESLLWVTAAALVFANLDSPVRVVAFAAGFATGTLMGGLVEQWVAMGSCMIRVMASVESPPVANALRSEGLGVTVVNAEGRDGEVRVTFTVVPRRRQKTAMAIITEINPEAFVTVEDVKVAEVARRQTGAVVFK
jgi:uncharacterized protein YebE (UPF0316 family)